MLEFALKHRIGKDALRQYIKLRKKKYKSEHGKNLGLGDGLKTLIEYSRDHELVKNKGFSAWYRHNRIRAYDYALAQAFEKVEETGKECVDIDLERFEFSPPGYDYDHIQHLITHTNKIRNIYAHGSPMLHKNVLYSFELVSEFINQIYPEV